MLFHDCESLVVIGLSRLPVSAKKPVRFGLSTWGATDDHATALEYCSEGGSPPADEPPEPRELG